MKNVKNTKRWLMLFIAATSLASASLSFGMKNAWQLMEKCNIEMNDIWHAIEKNDISRVEKLVKQEGFDSNQTDKYGYTLLYSALEENNLDIVRLLLNNGAKKTVNKAPIYGGTPLYLACRHNNLDKIRLLLENGAKESVNKADKYGYTPLYWACYNNKIDMVILLLDNGAKESINKANEYGNTPLYEACLNRNLKIVTLLLDNGAIESANKADNYGKTPLYEACCYHNLEIVRLLLEFGANIDQKSLDKAQTNSQNHFRQSLARQILATFNLTQRFDECVKNDVCFDLTTEESREVELCQFIDRLLGNRKIRIISALKYLTKALKNDRLELFEPLNDCAVICEKEITKIMEKVNE